MVEEDSFDTNISQKTKDLIEASQEGSVMWTVKKDQGDGFSNISKSELSGLATFINEALKRNPLVDGFKPILPVDHSSAEKFCASFSDGRLLIALVNLAKPNTIDVSGRLAQLQKSGSKSNHIARKRRQSLMVMEGLNEAISACQTIPGIIVVNVGALDFVAGKPSIILGLIWQLVAASFMNKIGLRFHPEIVRLLQENEKLEDFYKLPEDVILLRWINWHLQEDALEKGTDPILVKNFSKDIKDCRVYNTLLGRLEPTLDPANEMNTRERAQHVLNNISKLGVLDLLTTAKDIEKGNAKMNAALFAQIFNERSGLEALNDFDLTLVSSIAENENLQTIAEDLKQYIYMRSQRELFQGRGNLNREQGYKNWKALPSNTGLTDGILHLRQKYNHLNATRKSILVEADDDDDDDDSVDEKPVTIQGITERGVSIQTFLIDDTEISYKESANAGIFCFMCSLPNCWNPK